MHASPPSPASMCLWPLCLEIASRRRSRQPPPAADAGAPIAWNAAGASRCRGWGTTRRSSCSICSSPARLSRARGRPGRSASSARAWTAVWPRAAVTQLRQRAGDAGAPAPPAPLCDAVIVGAATAAIDNPQLTTRRVPGPHPVRVLLDPALRLPATLRVFCDRQSATLLACDAAARPKRRAAWVPTRCSACLACASRWQRRPACTASCLAAARPGRAVRRRRRRHRVALHRAGAASTGCISASRR